MFIAIAILDGIREPSLPQLILQPIHDGRQCLGCLVHVAAGKARPDCRKFKRHKTFHKLVIKPFLWFSVLLQIRVCLQYPNGKDTARKVGIHDERKSHTLIDHWVGLPLCVILTGVQRHKPAPPVRGILFVKLVEQGSTVRACSAIRRAIELVGRDDVYFLVVEVNSQRLVNGRGSSPSSTSALVGRGSHVG
jgi:hypothetical protein